MKTYKIYLSDCPGDPVKGNFKNKTEARAAARLYIKQWGLSATILKIDEVTAI